MSSLNIAYDTIPSLTGKTAIITGGVSGIGLAAANILAQKGAVVFILDINAPDGNVEKLEQNVQYRKCDINSWIDLRKAFDEIQIVDYVFANAGVSEEADYFADTFDSSGALEEPTYDVLKTNLRATLNTVKLAWSSMRRNKIQGSIVITSSATAYAPEQLLPVYSASKHALVGLIRALRSVTIKDGITINGIAPAATHTRLLPAHLAAPIMKAGLPVSSSHFVGLALVYSATATQTRRVEVYGKEAESELWTPGRWNGRVIFTLGESYTEIEECLSDLRRCWLGQKSLELTRLQQAATDLRE